MKVLDIETERKGCFARKPQLLTECFERTAEMRRTFRLNKIIIIKQAIESMAAGWYNMDMLCRCTERMASIIK